MVLFKLLLNILISVCVGVVMKNRFLCVLLSAISVVAQASNFEKKEVPVSTLNFLDDSYSDMLVKLTVRQLRGAVPGAANNSSFCANHSPFSGSNSAVVSPVNPISSPVMFDDSKPRSLLTEALMLQSQFKSDSIDTFSPITQAVVRSFSYKKYSKATFIVKKAVSDRSLTPQIAMELGHELMVLNGYVYMTEPSPVAITALEEMKDCVNYSLRSSTPRIHALEDEYNAKFKSGASLQELGFIMRNINRLKNIKK